jgi:glycosyltransferase involved in cell wall biosynthesis
MKTIKVLILTYYFPPCTATAGYRPYSWATHFKEHEIEPTIITRRWFATKATRSSFADYEDGPIKTEKQSGFTAIYLPYLPTKKRIIGEQWLKRSPMARKIYYFFLTLIGELNIDMDGRAAFQTFLYYHLKDNKYDAIIATAPPFNLVGLAASLSKKFKIPYFVDLRDLWNNNEMKKGFQYSGTDKVLYGLTKKHIGRWIAKAEAVTVATPPMAKFIEALHYKGRIAVLLNGYEKYLYNGNNRRSKANDKFIVSCIGTLYPEQKLDLFTSGFHLFLKENPYASIQLRFVGASFFPEVESFLKRQIPDPYLLITDRIPREEAIQEAVQSHVLFYAGWKGYEGILTTKIFDYLAAGKNILIAPGDGSSIDDLVKKTGSGKIANTPHAVAELLFQWYEEWKNKGELTISGNIEMIDNYSREKQTENFSNLIKHAIA